VGRQAVPKSKVDNSKVLLAIAVKIPREVSVNDIVASFANGAPLDDLNQGISWVMRFCWDWQLRITTFRACRLRAEEAVPNRSDKY
jgi:hypothetical protein